MDRRCTCLHRVAAVAFTAAGLLPGCIASAAAQPSDRPPALPTRDVGVIYQVSADVGSGVQKLQVTYAGGGDHIRLDYFRWAETPYPFSSVIVDRPANRLIGVQPERRRYFDRELGGGRVPGTLPVPQDTVFSRLGTVSILGLTCTDWQMRSGDKGTDLGTACVTEDGVTLRLIQPGAAQPAFIAIVVQYGPPPDGIFAPPADFQRIEPEQLPPPPPPLPLPQPDVEVKRPPPPAISEAPPPAAAAGPAGVAAAPAAQPQPRVAVPAAKKDDELPPGWVLDGDPKQPPDPPK